VAALLNPNELALVYCRHTVKIFFTALVAERTAAAAAGGTLLVDPRIVRTVTGTSQTRGVAMTQRSQQICRKVKARSARQTPIGRMHPTKRNTHGRHIVCFEAAASTGAEQTSHFGAIRRHPWMLAAGPPATLTSAHAQHIQVEAAHAAARGLPLTPCPDRYRIHLRTRSQTRPISPASRPFL
jgi:hypothetical protein